MAVNPGEDIVNVWLQDVKGYFTRQNVNVAKRKRIINGKAVYGGKGKEIDILGINNSGKRIWAEVTVSPNPYLEKTGERIQKALDLVKKKFHREKAAEVKRIFGNKKYGRIFVYSRRIFRREQEQKFQKKLNLLDIEGVPFERIFDETIRNIDHYSVDPTRIYLYYAKFFLKKKS